MQHTSITSMHVQHNYAHLHHLAHSTISSTNALAGRPGGLKKSINRLKQEKKSTTALEQQQAEVEAEMAKMRGNRSNNNRKSGRDSENDLLGEECCGKKRKLNMLQEDKGNGLDFQPKRVPNSHERYYLRITCLPRQSRNNQKLFRNIETECEGT